MLSNKLILVVLALALSGCATKEVVKYETVEVKIPVPVLCQTEEPKKPNFSFERLSTDSSIYEKVQSLVTDRLLHLGYEEQLRTALQSCK